MMLGAVLSNSLIASRVARRAVSASLVPQAQQQQRRWGGNIAVYLLDDVANRGAKGDVVEVKRGFARNFLIPRKHAVYATKDNLVKFRQEGQQRDASSAQQQETSQRIAQLVQQSSPLQFPRAVAPSGSLFGSVSEADVRQFLAARLRVREEDLAVEMAKPVKELGKHALKINGVPCEIEVTSSST